MTTRDYPQWLQELIDNPPKAGTGVHGWLWEVARNLHCRMPAVEIIELLQGRVANCGRHVPLHEITAAVKNSVGCAWRPKGTVDFKPTPAAPRWPAVNREQREAITRDGGGVADLWELSPIRIESNEARTEDLIDRLFPGNPLLCCGQSSSVFDTKTREEWRGQLAQLQLIVPSPMTDRTGLTKDGRESTHSLNNTGPRRFLICEFDTGTPDEHAALLIHLAGYAPLVCAVHSGGKSLHGWFFVEGLDEEKVRKFFRYACAIGADSRLWTRSQFCRMPDGARDNGKRQTVFFLNFKPLEARR